jgi:hypothetical protein
MVHFSQCRKGESGFLQGVKGRQIFRHTRSPVSAIFAVVFSFSIIDIGGELHKY